MKKKGLKMNWKVGICLLVFSLVLIPVAPTVCMAAEAAAGGEAGSGGAAGMSTMGMVGAAVAVAAAIAVIASALSDDDTIAATHAHTSAHH